MHVYLFSGLGVDDRAFQNIVLQDSEIAHIKWIERSTNESMSDYAGRLIPQIKITNPILVGLSFGGMIAVEVAKLIKTRKIILISSAKGNKNIPYYFRLLGTVRIHRLLPVQRFKRANKLVYWLFGVGSSGDRQLLKEILKGTDDRFLKWAIARIMTWDNTITPNNITQIGGTADHVLPFRFSDADVSITGGGHFMIINRAPEISEILNGLINN